MAHSIQQHSKCLLHSGYKSGISSSLNWFYLAFFVPTCEITQCYFFKTHVEVMVPLSVRNLAYLTMVGFQKFPWFCKHQKFNLLQMGLRLFFILRCRPHGSISLLPTPSHKWFQPWQVRKSYDSSDISSKKIAFLFFFNPADLYALAPSQLPSQLLVNRWPWLRPIDFKMRSAPIVTAY